MSNNLDYKYDGSFEVTEEYKKTLPDIQNSEYQESFKIEKVGIHNFKLPIRYIVHSHTAKNFYENTFVTSKHHSEEEQAITLETSVTGTVSLESQKRGINMSRIMRTFYKNNKQTFSIELLEKILKGYKQELESFEADLQLRFSYPIIQTSLRSNLQGFQYYDIVLEASIGADDNQIRNFIHLDYVYSSACPCSFELAEHARTHRNKATVSHSQRSVARISVEISEFLWIEELVDYCNKALQTETQVMVKREDEQAFAELNGSYLKFVEDAVRSIAQQLNSDKRIVDYKVVASHLESLHSHDAVAVILKGVDGGFTSDVSYSEFQSLKR